MHDVRWESWLTSLAREYHVAVFRPELPGPERLRAARRCREVLEQLRQGAEPALGVLTEALVSPDTQVRNAAARAVSELGGPREILQLYGCYLDPSRQWLAPTHFLRASRRVPVDRRLASKLGDLPLRLQPTVVQALLAQDGPKERVWLWRILDAQDAELAEAAVEAVARWRDSGLLWQIVGHVDAKEHATRAEVGAAIQACLWLVRGGEERAAHWIEERTLDEDPELMGLAHATLATLGWPRAIPELIDQLLDPAMDGAPLGYLLQAADTLASGALVDVLCELVLRLAERRGPGIDDNPADHAIRVLERITGRWVPSKLCSYDRHGNFDASTRRRAALLYRSVSAELDPDLRYRLGESLVVGHLVDDLLSASPSRVRSATHQLVARTGESRGLQIREDLVANVDAVDAWQRQARRASAEPWLFHGAPMMAELVG